MYKHLISFLSLLLTGLGTASAASGDTYVKVTSPSDLVVGGTYILAATCDGKTHVATSYRISDQILNTVSTGFVVDDNTISISTATPMVFTLGGASSGYTLNYNSTKYLGYDTSVNLKESTTVTNAECWTFSYNTLNGIYILKNLSSANRVLTIRPSTSGINTYYYIQANTESAVDNNNATPANLYRKVPAITLASACTDGTKYYGTYSNESAFVVPEGLTVSEIKVVDGKLTMGNYETGAVVPANTGVMVCSATAGAHQVTLSGEAGTSVFGSENMLKASGNDGITAAAMASADAGCKYYRLTMHNNVTLGFFWGAAEGAAFVLSANKAYLAVPTGDAARLAGFGMTDGEATGIEAVAGEKGNSETYNVLGQRVTAEGAKGIVIRNGKKRIVK